MFFAAFTLSASLVVGSLDHGTIAERKTFFVRQAEHAIIALAIVEGGRCLAGDAASLGGVRCAMLADETRRSIRWMLAVPVAGDYDNPALCAGEHPRGCHAPIAYREEELTDLRGRTTFDIAREPRLSALGTHRLSIRLVFRAAALTLPESSRNSIDDSTAAEAAEIVVRRDDGYTGLLTELLGVPFALGPVWLPGVGHQTDRRLAADCVALVIYGRRRMGEAVPYSAPVLLLERMRLVGSAPALVDETGNVADAGEVRPGDVLHFGFQTAVLSRDLPPIGRLDPYDFVIHSYHGVAEEVPLGRLPYRGHAVRVLRWPWP